MGDYMGDPFNGAYYDYTTEVNSDYCVNGDKCIKATRTQSVSNYIGRNITSSFSSGYTVQFTLDTWCEKTLKGCLYFGDSNGHWSNYYVIVPTGHNSTVISALIPEDTLSIWFRIDPVNLNVGDYFYTDNWCAIIQ